MPELPEVETVRRGLAPVILGRSIRKLELRRKDLRIPFPEGFAKRVEGAEIRSLRRRAKYLLADLSSGETLIIHLGMSGSLRIEGREAVGDFHFERSKDLAHDHVLIDFDGGGRLIYNDPRRFGLMTLGETAALGEHPLFRHLGLEPLDEGLEGTRLCALLAGKRTPIKAALLDQGLIVGIGNIYASEALFRAGLSPKRRAASVGPKRAGRLASALRDVLEEAIAAGGSTLRDFMQSNGSLGYFQHKFRVYDRAGESCLRPGCGGTVRRILQSNRSTFYCPACQR